MRNHIQVLYHEADNEVAFQRLVTFRCSSSIEKAICNIEQSVFYVVDWLCDFQMWDLLDDWTGPIRYENVSGQSDLRHVFNSTATYHSQNLDIRQRQVQKLVYALGCASGKYEFRYCSKIHPMLNSSSVHDLFLSDFLWV